MELICMKKILMLMILVLILVVNCSYFEGAERARRERGRECMYNYKGELQGCNYIRQKLFILIIKQRKCAKEGDMCEKNNDFSCFNDVSIKLYCF